MNWKILTKDVDMNNPEVKKLFKEASDAAPADYLGEDGAKKMLPRRLLQGRCSLCGKTSMLTKEHIPPFASGNKARHSVLTIDDWLRDKLDDSPEAKHLIEQGGIFGYTICRKCNSFTGTHYGNEYKKWVTRVEDYFNGIGPGVIAALNNGTGPAADDIEFGSKEKGSVKPGAFVRQVLSGMSSLSGVWDLAERYPEIRRIILEQSTEPLPKGMDLGMALFVGPKIRMGGPQLVIDQKTKTWRWVQEIAFPPFAFYFIVASNKNESGKGLMLNEMTLLSPKEERYYSGIVEIGFGWSPYPGDYRSQAAILAGHQIPHAHNY